MTQPQLDPYDAIARHNREFHGRAIVWGLFSWCGVWTCSECSTSIAPVLTDDPPAFVAGFERTKPGPRSRSTRGDQKAPDDLPDGLRHAVVPDGTDRPEPRRSLCKTELVLVLDRLFADRAGGINLKDCPRCQDEIDNWG